MLNDVAGITWPETLFSPLLLDGFTLIGIKVLSKQVIGGQMEVANSEVLKEAMAELATRFQSKTKSVEDICEIKTKADQEIRKLGGQF